MSDIVTKPTKWVQFLFEKKNIEALCSPVRILCPYLPSCQTGTIDVEVVEMINPRENEKQNDPKKQDPENQTPQGKPLIDPFIHLRPVILPTPEPGTFWGMDFFEEIPDEEWAAMQANAATDPSVYQSNPAEPVELPAQQCTPGDVPTEPVKLPTQQFPNPVNSTGSVERDRPAYTNGPNLVLPSTRETVSSDRGKKPTAYSVAQQLIRRTILLCVGGALYCFDGRVYRLLKDQDLHHFIMASCRSAIAEVGDASFIERIYKVLFAEPNIVKEECEQKPNTVVMEDGILDTKDWSLLPHSPDPEYFATSFVSASYSRGQRANCPIFDEFVCSIAGGEQTLMLRIWQAVGYLLSQDMRGKCFIVLQGVSDSGKSVLGNFIRGYFDSSNETSLDINSFAKNFALADLIGKRLCVDLDLPGAAINALATSFLKKMTGGDSLSTDVKYMSRVTFTNTAKFLFATNHPIITAQPDSAFMRRLVIIPFRFAVSREKQNFDLLQLLEPERDAIAVKALRYYAQLRESHFIFAGSYPANQVCEREDADGMDIAGSISVFLQSSCDFNPEAWTATSDLYDAFSKSCGAVIDYLGFSAAIPKLRLPGVQKYRKRVQSGSNPVSGFQGLKLRER